MKSPLKRLLPILMAILVLLSIFWYLFIYDREFTRDMLLHSARFFEKNDNHAVASWLYHQAYKHAGDDEQVALELAEQYRSMGNYTKAEYTLSNAIADSGSVDLYIALSKLYVEQDKLLDAATMLDNVADPQIRQKLEALRPEAPVASPAPGFYSQFIKVDITAPSGKLYVSDVNTYPSVETDAYSGNIALELGENNIYAIAVGDNGLVSPRMLYSYTVGGVVEEVTLADSVLNEHLRQVLGLMPGDRMMTNDLWTIAELTVPEGVTDYSGLSYLTGLEKLTIPNGKFENLQVLASLGKLQELSVTNAPVSADDLEIIASLPNLKVLTLSGCQLSSIQALSGATGITHLNLSSNTLRNVTPLSFLSHLVELDLSHNAITGLSAVASLPELSRLNISYNSVSSLEALANTVTLTQLDASHNSIGLLTGLEGLTGLTELNVSYNALTEVELLAGLTELKSLNISNNTILDITALSVLEKLETFDFSYNEIEVLPDFSKACPLISIDGSHNLLTDLSPLVGMPKLNLVLMDSNSIENIDDLIRCPMLIRVNVYDNPVPDVSVFKDTGIIVNYTPNV